MGTDTTGLRERLEAALGGTYAIERELGGGGMSRVFVAQDARLGRRVVVKVLHPDLAAGVSARRFEREIRLAARLQHPHVVPLLSAGEVDGLPYYTMPFVQGESLRQRLAREGALPVGDAVRLVRELADALSYAHGEGVVHRDLKPENVLLSGGHAVVADFGVAKALASATEGGVGVVDGGTARATGLGVAVGTPAYMAPEQAAADPGTDHRADLYALGVVAYEALAGAHPFAGRSPQAMLAAHLTEAPAPLVARRPDVPPALGGLVTRLLAKQPEDRVPSAAEVVRGLDALATPSAGAAVVARGERDGLHRAFAVAAGVGILVLSGGWLVVQSRRPTHAGGSAPPSQQAEPSFVERRVAVAPFENQSGDSALAPLGRLISDWVAQGLAAASLAEVVDPQAVQAALRQPAGAAGLGASTGARLVVSGTYYREGDSLRLLARITDARAGKLVAAIEPVSAPAAREREAVGALRERVLGAVGGLLDGRTYVSGSAGLPPSLAVYRHYIAGQELYFRGAYRAARAELLAAARLDSTFVSPVLSAAVVSTALDERGTADSLFRVIDRSRDRLTPDARHLLDAWWAENRSDWAEALRAGREAARLAPSGAGPMVTAWNALRVNRPREVLSALALWNDRPSVTREVPSYWDVLTHAYHVLGDYHAELAAAVRGRGVVPDHLGARVDEVRALAALGRLADAERRMDEVLDLEARAGAQSGGRLTQFGRELRVHGHEAAAQAAFDRALRWYDAHPPAEQRAASFRRDRARALYAAGRWDAARAVFDALAAELPAEAEYRGYLGALAVRHGDRAAALAADRALADWRGTYPLGVPTYWRARIAALLGAREQATILLRQALQEGRTYYADVHPEADFASLRDVAAFQELIRPKE